MIFWHNFFDGHIRCGCSGSVLIQKVNGTTLNIHDIFAKSTHFHHWETRVRHLPRVPVLSNNILPIVERRRLVSERPSFVMRLFKWPACRETQASRITNIVLRHNYCLHQQCSMEDNPIKTILLQHSLENKKIGKEENHPVPLKQNWNFSHYECELIFLPPQIIIFVILI